MFEPESIPTMDTIAELFGIAPLALIVLAALTTAFTEWLKTKTQVEGWKTLISPFGFAMFLAMLLPGIPVIDKFRVGIMAAVVSVLGWELLKGVAGKFAEKKTLKEAQDGETN